MERLKERQEVIVASFKHQFVGRGVHGNSSWTDLGNSIDTYTECCQTVIERLTRQKSLPDQISVSFLLSQLYDQLASVIKNDSFPVSALYLKTTLDWLSERLPSAPESLSSEDEEDHQYEFKTYFVGNETEVTCLEEFRKMANEDGTTGLVTWQGALALLNFVISQSSEVLSKGAKILELGSGAGLFGLGMLKLCRQDIDSYIFSDVHPFVLNSIATNYRLNFTSLKTDKNALSNLLVQGPKNIDSWKCDQNITVTKLDWLDCTDQQINNLDFNLIFGSDLTYVLSMLHPLAILLRRLLCKAPKAYIACTHRSVNSIEAFLGHLKDENLKVRLALKSTFSPQDNCVLSHEPLHKISIFEITDSS